MFETYFSLSIFAYRETSETLTTCINKCIIAAEKTSAISGTKVVINVLINGNQVLFEQMKQKSSAIFDSSLCSTVYFYFFPFGDKANTWNQYFHLIGPNAKFHVFIDGYVFIHCDTFEKIAKEYENDEFVAATGIPTIGRSAKTLRAAMLEHGGIHGNLCVFTDSVKNNICEYSFFIPVGLYRTDSLIAAIVNFNFCPKENKWNSKKVRVISSLTWDIEPNNYFSLSFALTHYKRLKRQIQGQFENRAIRDLLAVQKIEIGDLPIDVETLLAGYLKDNPSKFWDKIFSPLKYKVHCDIQKKILNYKQTDKCELQTHEILEKQI